MCASQNCLKSSPSPSLSSVSGGEGAENKEEYSHEFLIQNIKAPGAEKSRAVGGAAVRNPLPVFSGKPFGRKDILKIGFIR